MLNNEEKEVSHTDQQPDKNLTDETSFDFDITLLYERFSVFERYFARFGLDTENIVQESYVRAWLNQSSYNPELSKPHVWLSRIIRNVAIDESRKNVHNLEFPSSDKNHYVLVPSPTSTNPEDIALENDVDRVLVDVISNLKTKQAIVASLFLLESWTLVRIAEHLDEPLGTIKRRWAAAKENLQRNTLLISMLKNG